MGTWDSSSVSRLSFAEDFDTASRLTAEEVAAARSPAAHLMSTAVRGGLAIDNTEDAGLPMHGHSSRAPSEASNAIQVPRADMNDGVITLFPTISKRDLAGLVGRRNDILRRAEFDFAPRL